MNFFITATNTDVGKTFITCSLLKAFLNKNISVRAIKPVQTGCFWHNDNLLSPDVEEYKKVNSQNNIAPKYTFEYPASPHFSAQLENKIIQSNEIINYIQQFNQKNTVSLIEGAGGILVPLNEQETFLDIMKILKYPIILVCKNELGSLNTTLLSIETLQNNGLKIAAIVFNFSDQENKICQSNIKYLKQHFDIPIIEIPKLENADFNKISYYFNDFVKNTIKQKEYNSNIDFDFDQKHLIHPYTVPTNPVPVYGVVNTFDNKIQLENGQILIDGISSWWCAALGYRLPEIKKVAISQINTLPHIMFGGLTHQPAIELGKKLLQILPEFEHIFYSDSGSVAVEVAIKMALQYQQNNAPKKRKILTVLGGYHGDTLGAMSVCDPEQGMHLIFNGILAEQIFAPRPECRFEEDFDSGCLKEIEEIFACHHQEIAAVIIEPIVQGASGMWFYHPEYLNHLRELCNQYNALLIFDEIATGFGRTGKLFAYQHTQIVPDIICIGKALTSGIMSLAATICTHNVAEVIGKNNTPFMHGPTFMANPLACSIALESIQQLQKFDWKNNVLRISGCLKKYLYKCFEFDIVKDIRILGAVGVVELKMPVNIRKIQPFFIQQGVWIRPFANLIYLMPPFITSDEDLIQLCNAIYQALAQKQY